MNFLFFDIECSNGHDMCSFGYVLTDNKFNIIKKEDIVMNPEAPFILSSSRKRPKIRLAYTKKYFYTQPTFDHFYNKIKNLLEDKKTTVLGHSILSDMHFLNFACERYNLPYIEVNGFDTQKLFQQIYKTKHAESLEAILDKLNITSKLQFHKSCDDAEGVLLITKQIFKDNNLNIDKIKSNFKNTFLSSKNIKPKTKQEKLKDKIGSLSMRTIKISKTDI